ncbi:rhomboid family intramembrane serine protease [Xanthomarina sp. F1114]|uniref:rhomboid family intramembrane serine protease n=1 Tax=Xanthomarina sp. F1114 TaxID=2996019 RepID=UPI00225DE87C|nr:rhomboid family intramembrane serine protease [Xanthomarina sp. F1114]MCX7547878.1 rhomboid family intramembrane serine protease [Xanthomarina sp. F1114]
MKSDEHFQFSNSVILAPIFFVLLIWLVFWVEIRFGLDFTKLGIYPQTLKGLRGVVFSPFIHSGITHLYHNTIPLFVLTAALFYFYKPIAWKVLFYGILLSGLITWSIGRPSYHIGASGLIYVLVSFTFFKGILAKHYRLIALSLLVVFLYGSMIWYVLPIKEGVSWEGHTAGLVTGLLFAIIFKKQIASPKKYAWEEADYNEEEDPFLKHFDENGNFIETLETETRTDSEAETKPRVNIEIDAENVQNSENEVIVEQEGRATIRYTYKPNKE